MLAVEDRIAIQDLYIRYCLAIDTDDAEAWADTYALDSRFIYPASTGDKTIEGRDRIYLFAQDQIAARPSLPYKHRQHWTANLVVEGEGSEARGACYLIAYGENKASGEVVITSFGYYQDRLVLGEGRWLFSERRLIKDRPLPTGLTHIFG